MCVWVSSRQNLFPFFIYSCYLSCKCGFLNIQCTAFLNTNKELILSDSWLQWNEMPKVSWNIERCIHFFYFAYRRSPSICASLVSGDRNAWNSFDLWNKNKSVWTGYCASAGIESTYMDLNRFAENQNKTRNGACQLCVLGAEL